MTIATTFDNRSVTITVTEPAIYDGKTLVREAQELGAFTFGIDALAPALVETAALQRIANSWMQSGLGKTVKNPDGTERVTTARDHLEVLSRKAAEILAGTYTERAPRASSEPDYRTEVLAIARAYAAAGAACSLPQAQGVWDNWDTGTRAQYVKTLLSSHIAAIKAERAVARAAERAAQAGGTLPGMPALSLPAI